MFAIAKTENPVQDFFQKMGVSLNDINRKTQKALLNPEILVEFECRGVTKGDLQELVTVLSKVSRIYYSS